MDVCADEIFELRVTVEATTSLPELDHPGPHLIVGCRNRDGASGFVTRCGNDLVTRKVPMYFLLTCAPLPVPWAEKNGIH